MYFIPIPAQQNNNRNRHNTYHPEIITNPIPVIDECDSWKSSSFDENNKNITNENNNVHTTKGSRGKSIIPLKIFLNIQ